MKKIILLAALSGFTFACSNQQKTETSTQVKSDSTKVAKAETFQCPMKCEGEKTYASAQKCPTCGMDLAKVE